MQEAKYDRTLLYGLPEIAAYIRMSVPTARRWIRQEALPVGKLPDGRWVTSTELIDRWVEARNPYLRNH